MIAGGAHHRTAIVDRDVVCFRQVEFGLLCRNAEREVLHHLAVFGPADMLLVVIAHADNVGRRCRRHESGRLPAGPGCRLR